MPTRDAGSREGHLEEDPGGAERHGQPVSKVQARPVLSIPQVRTRPASENGRETDSGSV